MKTITVYEVLVNEQIKYSCLDKGERDEVAATFYAGTDEQVMLQEYEYTPVDHTKK